MELHIKYNSQSQKPKQMKSLLIPRIGKVWKNGNSCVIFGRLLITTDSLGTIWYYPGNIEKVNIPQPSNSTLYIFFITNAPFYTCERTFVPNLIVIIGVHSCKNAQTSKTQFPHCGIVIEGENHPVVSMDEW
jgi:hypothetical protein